MRRGIEPSVTPNHPPPSPPPCYPSTCCGFVCGFGRALAFSKKPTLTTHFNRAHTQAGIKAGKISCHRVLLLSGWKCHRNKVLTMKGYLHSPLKVMLVKLWSYDCRQGEARFTAGFIDFGEKFSHTTVEWCLCSDIWYKNNQNTVLHSWVESDQNIMTLSLWD